MKNVDKPTSLLITTGIILMSLVLAYMLLVLLLFGYFTAFHTKIPFSASFISFIASRPVYLSLLYALSIGICILVVGLKKKELF